MEETLVPESSLDGNGRARQALRMIITDPELGAGVLSNPRTLTNVLKDLLPDSPSEARLLVAASEADLAGVLRRNLEQGLDPGATVRLAESLLAQRQPFTADACRWVTGEFAMALGIDVCPPAQPGAAQPAGSGGAGSWYEPGPVAVGTATLPGPPGAPATGPLGWQPPGPVAGYPPAEYRYGPPGLVQTAGPGPGPGRRSWAGGFAGGAVAVAVAVALTWFLVNGSGASQPPKAWFSGTWTGQMSQPIGVVSSWTARLTLPPSGRVGTFLFSPIGCSGSLVVTRSSSTTVSMYEDLTRNPNGVCAPGGMITLTKSGPNGAEMRWQDSTHPANIASGHLTLG